MKNFKNILCTLLLVILISSCKDEYVEHGKLNDISFTTSLFRSAPWQVAAGKFVIFSDLSQGALTHEWSIVSDSCSFLEGRILKGDTIFDQFKVPGLISTNKNATILFLKGGVNKIRLRNTFSDSVCFRGSTAPAISGQPYVRFNYPSKKVGSVWVIDTTFVVNVYGKTLFDPKVEAYLSGGLPFTSDTITVKVKTFLYFKNMTGGFPSAQNFSFGSSSGIPATINVTKAANPFPIKFTTVGIYNQNSMTTYRDAVVATTSLPAAPSISLNLPVIKVIP